ncbi:MAG TPA: hypothetical protein VLJ37_08700 [bacterium]|nr:hypothetical protein [bacterium]
MKKTMSFRRFILGPLALFFLSACLPSMSPAGSPANPAGVKESADAGTVSRAEAPEAPAAEADPQIASSDGGFAPKPDEASVQDPELVRDWRAFYGDGPWLELSKVAPASLTEASAGPFTLHLDVEQYVMSTQVITGMAWVDAPPGITIRLVLKPEGGDASRFQAVDAKTQNCEVEGCGYNMEFRDLSVPDGLIDVYAYQGALKPDGTRETPPADVTAFLNDPRRRYLGTFSTKLTLQDRTRRNSQMVRPPL